MNDETSCRPGTSRSRHRATSALALLAFSLLVPLAACTDSDEAPPAPTGGGEVSRTEVRPESGGARPSERTPERPSSGPTTPTSPEYPPSKCPPGLVC